MPKLDLGQVMGPQGPQGVQGPQGAQGVRGEPGRDAVINGQSVLTIVGERGVELKQEQDVLTIGTPTWPSNPNLLDNAYFIDPINQRGKVKWTVEAKPETNADPNTEYSFMGGYTIDRWILNDGFVKLSPNGISVAYDCVLYQRMDGIDLNDGVVRTVSYLDGDGNVYSGILTSGYTFVGHFLFAYSDGSAFYMKSSDDNVKCLAVKLELGDRQTLAHKDAGGNWVLNDPPPNKALELLKCQRYFQLRGVGLYAMVNNQDALFTFPLHPAMQGTPAVSCLVSEISFFNGWTAYTFTVSGVSGQHTTKDGVAYVSLAGTWDNTPPDGEMLRVNSAGHMFAIDANL